MAEVVVVHGKAGGTDNRGYPLPAKPDKRLQAKSVQPLSLEELGGQMRDGVIDVLRVWLLRGQGVEPNDEVTIRGRRYVVEKTSWDYGQNRVPWNHRHRPSQVFDAVRGGG